VLSHFQQNNSYGFIHRRWGEIYLIVGIFSTLIKTKLSNEALKEGKSHPRIATIAHLILNFKKASEIKVRSDIRT
jgi:hypothetical protein